MYYSNVIGFKGTTSTENENIIEILRENLNIDKLIICEFYLEIYNKETQIKINENTNNNMIDLIFDSVSGIFKFNIKNRELIVKSLIIKDQGVEYYIKAFY